ncbi:hypothetical protein FQN54_001915 [Arachnomyces sp. PD_36]|nr:hypothetical protein FQN54_001915 [Arachnomyces sp. PD_36]
MSFEGRPNVSSDLVWEIARNQNSFLVKRNSGGGSQFSRDPRNLTNKNSRKHAGFANTKAIGVQASEEGGVTLTSKKADNAHQPGQNVTTTTFGPNTGNRKIYKAVANRAAKNGYRADLRPEAVSRASAIRQSQRPKKDTPENKPRGSKAKKAAEESA